MHIDACDRLWLIDDSTNKYLSVLPKLVIIDLNTDKIIKEHNLSQHIKCKSSFRNLIVEVNETDCEAAYAYVADPVGPALVVYSLKDDDSWRVHHAFFSFDPLSTDYNTGNLNYQKYRGILGMALSRPKGSHKMLIFQPQSSNNIFVVRTDILKDASKASNNFHKFKVFGYKGKNSQSSTLTFEKQNGILFYGLVNQNAIGCWNSDKFGYDLSEGTVGIVAKNDTSLVNISDLKVDSAANLWILSNKYPLITHKGLNEQEINFRIFSVPVNELIANTICEKVTDSM